MSSSSSQSTWAQKLRDKADLAQKERDERALKEFNDEVARLTRAIEAQASKGFYSMVLIHDTVLGKAALEHIYKRDVENFERIYGQGGALLGLRWD